MVRRACTAPFDSPRCTPRRRVATKLLHYGGLRGLHHRSSKGLCRARRSTSAAKRRSVHLGYARHPRTYRLEPSPGRLGRHFGLAKRWCKPRRSPRSGSLGATRLLKVQRGDVKRRCAVRRTTSLVLQGQQQSLTWPNFPLPGAALRSPVRAALLGLANRRAVRYCPSSFPGGPDGIIATRSDHGPRLRGG